MPPTDGIAAVERRALGSGDRRLRARDGTRGCRRGVDDLRGSLELAIALELRGLFFDLATEDLLHPAREIFARIELTGGVHERLELVVEIDRVLVAILGILRERLQHDALELVGNAAVVRRRRQDLDVANFLERRKVALADEQPLAGEQLVEHDAAREHVAAPIDRNAADLLGRHVAELALEDAGLRLVALVRGLRDAEVDDLDLALERHEDVLRRHVAVDEVELAAGLIALVVRVVEALTQLHDDEARLRDRHRLADLAAPIEHAAEIAAMNVLERDVVAAVDDAKIEDLRDVRVVQLDGELGLLDEHADELFVLRNVRKDPLDGNQPFEPLDSERLRAKHLGHAADVDPLEQIIFSDRSRLLHGVSSRRRRRPAD